MERVGLRRETHAVRESLHRSGRWLDVVGYALLADEWPATGPAGNAGDHRTALG
jgi:RimJ/RimL family protein N-acetyltransferase